MATPLIAWCHGVVMVRPPELRHDITGSRKSWITPLTLSPPPNAATRAAKQRIWMGPGGYLGCRPCPEPAAVQALLATRDHKRKLRCRDAARIASKLASDECAGPTTDVGDF